MDILQNIFGGGSPDNHQQRSQQYQQGYQSGGYDQLDDQDVFDRYQRTVQHAPPEIVAQAHEEAFNRLPPQQQEQIYDRFRQASNDPNQAFQYPGFDRQQGQGQFGPRDMGPMIQQAQRQQPDLLQQVLGGSGGALSSPMGKAAMAGVAAIVAGKLMGSPGSGGGPLGGGGGGILGGILGNRN